MAALQRIQNNMKPYVPNWIGTSILNITGYSSKSRKCDKVETVCEKICAEKKLKEKKKPPKKIKDSMWAHPNNECCVEKCPEMLPRFDELYFKESNKASRKYFQTWVECPTPLKKPRIICNYEKAKLPPMQKRKKTDCLDTARKSKQEGCKIKGSPKCPSFTLCGCARVRRPPTCKIYPGPKKCVKRCTPFPSFSECMKDRIKKPHPIECKCLNRVPLCDLMRAMSKLKPTKKK